MFYSDDLFLGLLLGVFSGLGVLALGKPESHYFSEQCWVEIFWTLDAPPCRIDSTLTWALSQLPKPSPPQGLGPDPSGSTMIIGLILPPRLLYFSLFLSWSFSFLPLLPLLAWALFLIHIDHFRWGSLVWKNKCSNGLLPLYPLLFIPGSKDIEGKKKSSQVHLSFSIALTPS